MKKRFVFLTSIFLSACVQLTPAGSRVQILPEEQRALVTPCKGLGVVSVSSKDALRNAAAALAGDTVIISHRDVETTTIIRGDVFYCSSESNNKSAIPAITTTTEQTGTEVIRKSNLCQSKGGAWISGQCVIPIE